MAIVSELLSYSDI